MLARMAADRPRPTFPAMTNRLRRTLIAATLIATTSIGAAVLDPAAVPAFAMRCVEECPGPGGGDTGGGSTAPPTITVTATLNYQDLYQGRSNRPIRFDKVEVWRYLPRFAGVWSWGNDRTVYTDGQGKVNTSFTNDYDGTVYALRVVAENAAVWVRPNPNTAAAWVPATLGFDGAFWREPGDDHPVEATAHTSSQIFDFSWTFTGWSAQHYNIADTLLYGHDYAGSRKGDGDALPEASVAWWAFGSSNAPFYNPVGSVLTLPSGPWYDDLVPWDDATLLHEYGHFLEHHLSGFYAMPSVHSGCDGVNQQHAWMEGFADYYSAVVLASLPANELYRIGAYSFTSNVYIVDFSPACAGSTLDGRALENRVAAVLWDLSDPAGTESAGYDPAPQRDRDVFQLFDAALGSISACPTVTDLRRAWLARGLSVAEIDGVFALNGVPTGDYPQVVPPLCTMARG